jgi:hypothetical protein
LCKKEGVTMQEYWNMISRKHHKKLVTIARKRDVDMDTAMRNIINYLKNDNLDSNRPEYFKDFITARHVEGLIDTITI